MSIRDTGRAELATPGTAVVLSSSSVRGAFVRVTALESNDNTVVIGNAGVLAGGDADALGTREGTPLQVNESHDFHVNDVNQLYLDGVTAGDGVTWTVFD